MTVHILPDDTARARTTDPLASHAAADVSARTRDAVRFAVLTIVKYSGNVSGEQINELYAHYRGDGGWPVVHHDSPRKRASDLEHEGFLERVESEHHGRNNRPVGVYSITSAGLRMLVGGAL